MPDAMLTVAEAAETLQVGVKLVRGWLRSGELRGVNVAASLQGGRQSIRIRESDLESFLASRNCLPDEKPVRRKRRQKSDVIAFF